MSAKFAPTLTREQYMARYYDRAVRSPKPTPTRIDHTQRYTLSDMERNEQ